MTSLTGEDIRRALFGDGADTPPRFTTFDLMDGSIWAWWSDKGPKHRLTRKRLDTESVRYFDYYGYLLHAGVGEVAAPVRRINNGPFWEENE